MIAKLRGAYDLVVLVGPPPGVDRWALEAVVGTADAVLACVSPEQARSRARRELRAAAEAAADRRRSARSSSARPGP